MTRPEFRDKNGNLIEPGYTVFYTDGVWPAFGIVLDVVYVPPGAHMVAGTPGTFRLRVRRFKPKYDKTTKTTALGLSKPTTIYNTERVYFYPPDLLGKEKLAILAADPTLPR